MQEDLDYLVEKTGGPNEVDPLADYMYRTVIPVEKWQAFLAAEAGDIDYTNFKDRVAKTDHSRVSTYMKVWGAMLGLQPRR